ncbi:hypothetical protein BXZ70DRAFT_15574 [Cristinia sonorae]|uniref:Uncharacterized protein n=1 Tax=Cristinia sonorae TaxID=1940300 RepID=A0A8K0XV02_9AGAR|nr:hypothetical protein BXZ70DRAFT_15574 [Cristinia sonorae]
MLGHFLVQSPTSKPTAFSNAEVLGSKQGNFTPTRTAGCDGMKSTIKTFRPKRPVGITVHQAAISVNARHTEAVMLLGEVRWLVPAKDTLHLPYDWAGAVNRQGVIPSFPRVITFCDSEGCWLVARISDPRHCCCLPLTDDPMAGKWQVPCRLRNVSHLIGSRCRWICSSSVESRLQKVSQKAVCISDVMMATEIERWTLCPPRIGYNLSRQNEQPLQLSCSRQVGPRVCLMVGYQPLDVVCDVNHR